MRRAVLALAVAFAAAAFHPAPATTVGPVSACADGFNGGQKACEFQYLGARVAPWAIAPTARSVVIEVRLPLADGGFRLIASCTASSAAPVCIGQPVALPAEGDRLLCHARGSGSAVYGCFSQGRLL